MYAVLFADTAAAVITHLNGILTEPVSGKVPATRPAKFVTVQRTGGIVRTQVSEDVNLTIEAWASRDDDAHDLAQLVRYRLRLLPGTELVNDTAVYQCQELSGPVNLPDPLSNQARFTFTVVLHVRGLAAA